MNELLTQEAIRYRCQFSKRLVEYALSQNAQKELYLRGIQTTEDITQPEIMDNEINERFIDIICSVLKIKKKKIALLPDVERDLITEGVGKTGLNLKLAGTAFPYEALQGQMQTNPEQVKMSFKKSVNTPCEIIASDMGYLGELNGQLYMMRPKGELLVAAWDICRHVYRMTDPTYYPGKQRTPEGRKRLKTILSYICLSDVDRLIAWEKGLQKIDVIFLLKPIEDQSQEMPIFERIPPGAVQSALLPAFLHPTLHKSRFWDRDRMMHQKRTTEILMRLQTNPHCFRIIMPFVKQRLPVRDTVKIIDKILLSLYNYNTKASN